MRTSDFDYHLPPDMIAQRPARPRDSSRLLVMNRVTDELNHHTFRELPQFLSPGDALVLNVTRVIPARLQARKVPTGGQAEVLLLKQTGPQVWETLVGGRGLTAGRRLQIESGPNAEILQDLGGPRRLVRFDEPIAPVLQDVGHMPLPPYIHTPLQHPDEYQTVFARTPGSSAAPTAGLHFTPELLSKIQSMGVRLVTTTLHIGLDTFAPVTEENPEQHAIHSEWCQLTPEAAQQINGVCSSGGRVIAVGTTAVRCLESAAHVTTDPQAVAPFQGPTDLFILPGYHFQVVDALITNFHLPRSTLLMLVSAFAGRERILAAYEVAKQFAYRFYSFGDAMLIL